MSHLTLRVKRVLPDMSVLRGQNRKIKMRHFHRFSNHVHDKSNSPVSLVQLKGESGIESPSEPTTEE